MKVKPMITSLQKGNTLDAVQMVGSDLAAIDPKLIALHEGQDSLQAGQRRTANLSLLTEMSSILRGAASLESMFPALLDSAIAALDTDSGTLSFYDLRSGELVHAVSRGWMVQTGKTPKRPESGIAGYVYNTGQPYLFNDLSTDPMSRPDARANIPPGWSGACIPLRTKDETAGVMFITLRHPRSITEDELCLLCAMGDIAGIAVHRTLLFQEAMRRLDQLQSLRAVDISIAGSLDLAATLEVLLNEVSRHQNTDAGAVYLREAGGNRLRLTASHGTTEPPAFSTDVEITESSLRHYINDRSPQVLTCKTEENQTRCLFCIDPHSDQQCLSIPLLAQNEVVGLLVLFATSEFPDDPEWHQFLVTLAGQGAVAIESARLLAGLQKSRVALLAAYDSTIEGWARALDLRDSETEGHSRRVTELTMALAKYVALPEDQLVDIRRGAMLHDVGKMAIPDSILHKPGPLSEAEWEVMRQHPVYARQMLSGIAYLEPALAIPYSHHERWDGTGYPLRLSGEEIPLEARVFAIVDVYDALLSHRPYRAAWSEADALAYIAANRGLHFDPQVVDVFLGSVIEGVLVGRA